MVAVAGHLALEQTLAAQVVQRQVDQQIPQAPQVLLALSMPELEKEQVAQVGIPQPVLMPTHLAGQAVPQSLQIL
jgi:hypothetical protein